MGLLKEYNIKGIPCNYMKVTSINADCLRQLTEVTLGVYLNRDARLQNSSFIIDHLHFTFNEVGISLERCYQLIKQSKKGRDLKHVDGKDVYVEVEKNEFCSAQDVFEPGQKGCIELAPPVILPTVTKKKPILKIKKPTTHKKAKKT